MSTHFSDLNPQQQNQIIDNYNSGLSMQASGEPFDVSRVEVSRALKRLGVPVRASGTVRRYKLNEHFFDEITDESHAYWMGFMASDGCIIKGRRSTGKYAGVKVDLKGSDIGHLIKLRNALESNQPIREYNAKLNGKEYPAARLVCHSYLLAKGLVDHGITPAKSLTLEPCTGIPDHLQKHFWLGYFDGDGTLFYKPERSAWVFIMLGTESMMYAFKDFLNSNDIYFEANVRLKHKRRIYELRLGGNNLVKKVALLLWGDATIYLDRKHELYKQLMDQPTPYDMSSYEERVKADQLNQNA